LRGSIPKMSAACSQLSAPLNARMMTSWTFIARSTAAAAKTMVTPLADHGYSLDRAKSGHFTCSRERTDHLLPTGARCGRLALARDPHILMTSTDALARDRSNPHG